MPGEGRRFNRKSAREAARRSAEVRRGKAAPRPDPSELSAGDERRAVGVLRELLGSKDERVRAAAATRLLDWRVKQNQREGPEQPRRIIFETRWLHSSEQPAPLPSTDGPPPVPNLRSS